MRCVWRWGAIRVWLGSALISGLRHSRVPDTQCRVPRAGHHDICASVSALRISVLSSSTYRHTTYSARDTTSQSARHRRACQAPYSAPSRSPTRARAGPARPSRPCWRSSRTSSRGQRLEL